jgi:hypothetical protein
LELIPEPKTDIARIFAEDPLKLTKDDIGALITKLRSQRTQFTLGNQSAGKMKAAVPSKKAQQAATALAGLKVDLDL